MKEVYNRSKKTGGNTTVGESVLQDLKLLNQYFNSVNLFIQKKKTKLLTVPYEKLITNPKEEVVKICEFINVEFEEQMLKTEKENDSSRLISKNHKRSSAFYTKEMFDKPISSESLEKWKTHLTTAEIMFINKYFKNKSYEFLQPYILTDNKKSLSFYLYSIKQLGITNSIKHLFSWK
jgi:hypothetical protein